MAIDGITLETGATVLAQSISMSHPLYPGIFLSFEMKSENPIRRAEIRLTTEEASSLIELLQKQIEAI